ncbi:MAG: GAF domain-containing protein [Halanaerobiales bacterium]|nr:GAF domain-containing protein [Halanaerobiales bacterium]
MGLDKKNEDYLLMYDSVKALLEGEQDWIANLANISALLYLYLENVNWVGFYLLKESELVLGPFQGKPACIRIEVGSGVCGTAVKEKKAIIVDDVDQFKGHIACDTDSKSEIVIPLVKKGEIIGVLDIDSPLLNNFNEVDKIYLEKMVRYLIDTSNI